MKKLLVTVSGATGTQGGALARTLLRRGHRVRAMTRTPARAEPLRQLGAEVVTADFDEPASLDAAVSGADAVFVMSTPFEADLDAEVRQGRALVDAAARARVPHTVFSSATNADRDTGIPHFDSKYRIERHLAEVTEDWTVLAPAAFMDNFLTGHSLKSLQRNVFAFPMRAWTPLQLIPASDIAEFAALTMERREQFLGKRVDIASDECTGDQIAGALSGVTGRPIQFERVPIEVVRGFSTDLAAMFEYFDSVGMDVDIPALRAAYPEVGWHTFTNWAASALP
ncbi:NmrA/HSCARG family protein [Kutzneria albida]|uniref:NmrA-like domain-containing protein n=1 Tax=Kutzneria albida DSM 43870 TaxID=1449976 RepID=W5WHM3_9PSEU|nr:NmrA/HSCARG family protein [Kutzneria albida]AHI00246.1 hypothetical protein KALB_6887 [Kutzneria albida DSM 43870]